MVSFSIVIPAFNEEELIGDTLQRVKEAVSSCGQTGEVIVVDNNSTDQTATIAKAFGVRVVFEPHNQIARARNSGARHALGEKLIFLDADSQLSPELLRHALAALERSDIVGGGALIRFGGNPGVFGQWCLNRWNALSVRFKLAAGSFFFARKEAFNAVGGFSEQVYAGEEITLSRKLTRWGTTRGMRIHIITESFIITSPRKLEWYPPWQILSAHLILALCPPLMSSRRFCRFWYSRPTKARPQ